MAKKQNRWKAQRNAEMLYRFVVHESRQAHIADVYGINPSTANNILVREACRLIAKISGDRQLPMDLLRQAIQDRYGTAYKVRAVLALTPQEVEKIVKSLPTETQERINSHGKTVAVAARRVK